MKGKDLKGVKKMPIGGLDSDTSLQLVEPSDYLDALNLQNINKTDANEDIDIQALKGNIVGFKIDDLAVQNKVVTLLLTTEDLPTNPDFAAGNITTIKVFTQTGYEISSTILDTTMADSAAYAAAIQADLITAGQANATATSVAFTGSDYAFGIEIQIDNGLPREDFTVTSTAAAPNNVVFNFTTKQESINQLLAGDIQCIGSDNIEQDLFIYGTTLRTKEFTTIGINAVTNVVDAGALSIANVQTSDPHGLTTGDSVLISSNGGLADGVWQVFVVDATNLSLYNSQYGVFAAGSGGLITKYVEGYGSIYYANRDIFGLWKETISSTESTAIRLVGAKGLNMLTIHQIDSAAKKNNFQTKFKYTDNYNNPKMLLYKESTYMTDGFIFYPSVRELAIYNYSSIGQQSNLMLGVEDLEIDVSEIIGGGQVTTKNYGFCVRLSNDDNSSTAWSFQSPVISIIKQDTTSVDPLDTLAFSGDVSAEPTNKAILLEISGIPSSEYKYIEIAVVSYTNATISSIKSSTKLNLDLSATSYSYVYDGSLTDFTDISLVDLLQIQRIIKTALNIVDIDNRTALSNCTFNIDPVLTALATSITVSVKQESILKKGTLSATVPLSFGEYELVENIINKTGYHFWDIVPVGIMFKLKNGGWTRSYFIDNVDIKAGLIASSLDYSMTDATDTFSTYLEVTNINWDYLVDGVRLRDLVDDARITIGEINSEVIASGIFVLGDTVGLIESRPRYTGIAVTGAINRNVGFFYSPDFNNAAASPYVWQSGDRVIILGNANLESTYGGSTFGNVAEFDGQLSANYQNLSIDAALSYFPIPFGTKTFAGFPVDVNPEDANIANAIWNQCYALYVDDGGAGASSTTAFTDLGIYNAVIIRPQAQLYPTDTSLINFKPINGITIDVANDTTATTYDVFGGDTFTIKKYTKVRDTAASIDGLAIGYYTQSKQNTQLSSGTFPVTNLTVAPTTVLGAVSNYIANISDFLTERYDKSFNILNLVDNIVGYSADVEDEANALATVYWSQQAFEDSAQNNDRIFLPLDNKALDLSYGAIIHMVVANDILYTLQPNKQKDNTLTTPIS
jgi:hypothetical protein